MADHYSNHYSGEIGTTGHFTTLQTPVVDRVKSGVGGARLRVKVAHFTMPATTLITDNEIVRMMDVMSGDRPLNLWFSCNDEQHTLATWNYGLYQKGANNDGAVIDEDVFASVHDEIGAIERVDLLTESAILDNWDRGKTFWELATIGALNLTEDPRETWTIVKQATQTLTVVNDAVECSLELHYLAAST